MSDFKKYKANLYKSKEVKIESFLWEHGSIFHSFDYLNAVGQEYICIVIEDNEYVFAALPLVKSTKSSVKAYHIPPHTHIFGPVVNKNYLDNSYDLIKKLLQSLPKAWHYDFKLYNNGDVLPYLESGFSINTVQSHIFESTKEYSAQSISKTKVRDIKNLNKLFDSNKITVIENENSQNKHLLDLYIETSKRAGFRPKLDKLISLVNSDISFYSNVIKDVNGNAIAGTFCPKDNNNLYHILSLGLRLEDKLLSKANYLSLFLAISFANKNNLNFDFEGSSIPGVAQFYRMMGGEPMTMVRIQKSPSLFYQFLRFVNTIKSEFRPWN
jgi:hypothetical protein